MNYLENEERKDDGSLSFLKIKPRNDTKHFYCKENSQYNLVNKTFWIIDYIKDIKTKFGENRYLVKVKFNVDDPDPMAHKFFTNSPDIKHVLDEIKKLNAFPRKVTLKIIGTRYYFE